MKRILLLPLLLLACSVVAQNKNPDVVTTDAGKVSGLTNQAGDVHIYKGIPFAAPPVGDLRWKEPQPVKPWDDVKKCTDFAASPMQGKPDPFGVYTREFLIPYGLHQRRLPVP